jgi:crotonobetainyl-CoA:carnitine CoA-transferase CaiB-like acyl-CoA transferase
MSVARTDVPALTGVRVLQTGTGKAAAFCAKLLADLDAHVVVLRPGPGDPVGADGPFHPDDEAGLLGGLRLYLDAGKELLEGGVDESALAELVATFDVLVEDEDSASYRTLDSVDPSVVRCSISPFGRTGPLADAAASHLNVFHAGGESAVVPLPGDGWPVLQSGSEVGWYDVGAHAAGVVIAAVIGRRSTGLGQSIDISAQEVLVSANRTFLLRYLHDGLVYDYNQLGYSNGSSLYATADGHVVISFGIQEKAFQALAAMPEGEPFADPGFADGGWRTVDARALFVERLRAWCEARATADVVEVLERAGWPIGAVNGPADLLASAQLRERAFFRTLDHPLAGAVPVPGRPFRITSFPSDERTPARAGRPEHPPSVPRPPLEGIRVLDFTWAAAGPYATFLLAELGAEVIKVEHPTRPDTARRGFLPPPPERCADGDYPYGSIESSPDFNDLCQGKRSLRLDLSRPDAAEIVHRILPACDIVISNFRPGIMDKLGLAASTLIERHPGLIVAESSAAGSTGPERTRAGYANIFSASGGLSAQTGFADGPPAEGGLINDFRSGSAVAYGVLAALALRQRTGEGQFVDVSCQEVIAAFSPDALLRESLGAPHLGRMGNHHPRHAPHNVYRAAGVHRWMTLVVETDDEWLAVCDVIDRPDLVKSHPTAARRKADEAHIDALITAWTTRHDPFEASALLRARGVRAMPCLSNRDLSESEHLAERQMFRTVTHPVMGDQVVVRAPWVVDPDYRVAHRAGPLLGEANDYVLDVVVGVTGPERDRLAAALG